MRRKETINARDRAVRLVAEDEKTDDQIAAELGIVRATLSRWKLEAPFQEAVNAMRQKWRDELAAEGLALRENRVAALNDRWHRMQQIIRERAEDETMNAPGASSGLLVRTYKVVGVGKAQTTLEEYSVDTGLLREMREHEKQAAQELGQWAEKREITGKDGGPLEIAQGMNDAELLNNARAILDRLRTGDPAGSEVPLDTPRPA